MMHAIVYPFEDGAGLKKYFKIFQAWSASNKACCFLGPSDKEHKVLGMASAGQVTISILGHCVAGGNFLRSQASYDAGDTNEAPGKTIRAEALAALLKELGLNNNITARVKCLNCCSGNYDSFDGWDEAAFASKLKNAFNNGELASIPVYGYIGDLTLIPAPVTGVPVRKFAIHENDAGGQKAFRGRDVRIEMTGNSSQDQQAAIAKQAFIKAFTGDTGIML